MKMDSAHNDATTARMVFPHLYADLDELIVDDLWFHSENYSLFSWENKSLIKRSQYF